MHFLLNFDQLVEYVCICQIQDGWTPLHLAVQAQRTDVVRLLLIKGADKTLKNKVNS
jgi:ankyrin repeat protein